MPGSQTAIGNDLPKADPKQKPKRGRKPKTEKSSDDGVDIRWNREMVEALMKYKFETYKDYFIHTSNNRKKGEGWIKIQLAMNKKFDKPFTVLQVKGKYQNLNRKWRDNSANGKETTKTGNEPIDPSNCKDEEFDIISQYFAQQPGYGIDLGQATDTFEDDSKRLLESEDDGDEIPSDMFSPDRKRQKTSNPSMSPIVVIGDKMDRRARSR
jgi:hypothetical protein